ncbi:COX assembly mitochondrial protein [Quillaja saponaria]|uniref:COX assembly mitochondrial protein n=1 Tax=Quillaja saponaria TaxID=32244 RepID=A0AAD7PXX5_QUISA|nr:COX assembly mitochondrial protein [Quillaja saponaria]
MGFVQEARENHVKKKVEEDNNFVSFKAECHVEIRNVSKNNKISHFLSTQTSLRSKMKQKALKECDHYTSKYAQCASGRTFSVVWQCRKEAKELNNCLHQYTNDAVLEEMKKDYMLHDGKGSARV